MSTPIILHNLRLTCNECGHTFTAIVTKLPDPLVCPKCKYEHRTGPARRATPAEAEATDHA